MPVTHSPTKETSPKNTSLVSKFPFFSSTKRTREPEQSPEHVNHSKAIRSSNTAIPSSSVQQGSVPPPVIDLASADSPHRRLTLDYPSGNINPVIYKLNIPDFPYTELEIMDSDAFWTKMEGLLEEKVNRLIEANKELKLALDMAFARIEQLERNEKKNNFMLSGFKEIEKESNDDRRKIMEKLAEKLRIDKIDYTDCYRVGRPGNPNRSLLVKCLRKGDKHNIFANAKELKGSNIYINHDLTASQRKIEKMLRDHLKQMKATITGLRGTVRNSILTTYDKDKIMKYTVRDSVVLPMQPSSFL